MRLNDGKQYFPFLIHSRKEHVLFVWDVLSLWLKANHNAESLWVTELASTRYGQRTNRVFVSNDEDHWGPLIVSSRFRSAPVGFGCTNSSCICSLQMWLEMTLRPWSDSTCQSITKWHVWAILVFVDCILDIFPNMSIPLKRTVSIMA